MLLFTPLVISFEQFQPIGADISVDHIFVKCKEDVSLLKCEENELT